MRRISLIALVVALSFSMFSCNQKKLEQLEAENKALKETTTRQDSVLNDFLATFNEIDNNLSEIKEREQIIAMRTDDPEMQRTGKDMIIEDIQVINELLAQNKEKIDNLNKRLSGSNMKLNQFKAMVSKLNNQVTAKDGEITTLKQQLASQDFEIEALNGRIAVLSTSNDSLVATIDDQTARLGEQEETINDQTTALNTVYFITGSFKELRENDVLEKEGGVAGIGRTAVLKDDFDDGAFTEVDLRDIDLIPVSQKKAEILTNHPSGSYRVVEENKMVQSIEILDPGTFWSNSKYLVVMTN
ncbi:MAG: hypothetical protein AAF824_07610 [Bacteroidota bacterium]